MKNIDKYRKRKSRYTKLWRNLIVLLILLVVIAIAFYVERSGRKEAGNGDATHKPAIEVGMDVYSLDGSGDLMKYRFNALFMNPDSVSYENITGRIYLIYADPLLTQYRIFTMPGLAAGQQNMIQLDEYIPLEYAEDFFIGVKLGMYRPGEDDEIFLYSFFRYTGGEPGAKAISGGERKLKKVMDEHW